MTYNQSISTKMKKKRDNNWI